MAPPAHLFISNLMTYINREIDDIYIVSVILCLYHVSISSFIFSRSVLVKLLKHVKLIVFENIMHVNQKICFC